RDGQRPARRPHPEPRRCDARQTPDLARRRHAHAGGVGVPRVALGQAGEFDKLANSDARQFVLAHNYNLSTRTRVYTTDSKVDDEKGVSAFGGDFSSIAVGVRHNF
ncbi:MAG: hypothetical protein RL227_2912, partial [Pseudomonadota bacterium]